MSLQDFEVDLLIRYNCAHALLLKDIIIIAPKKNGPFAQKTDLGWGIVGIVGNCKEQIESDSVGVSEPVLVYDVDQSLFQNENGAKEWPCVCFIQNKGEKVKTRRNQ